MPAKLLIYNALPRLIAIFLVALLSLRLRAFAREYTLFEA